MKGSDGIPALKLTVLNKLIQKFPKAPNAFFSDLFGTEKAESDSIKWEIEYGSAGMTPFVAPGAPAPSIGSDGVGEGSAKAAYFKEKMYFDEEFLNNLRQPGTESKHMTAERQLARGMQKLRNRCDRRREWMNCQMMTNGGFNYVSKGGTRAVVSYGVPESHLITLDTDRKWGTGASRNPIEDIFEAKQVLADDAGVTPEYAMLNSDLLKTLILDEKIQALLTKSSFGNGDLFANPGPVIAQLLGVGKLAVYDEMYEISGWLMGPVVGGSTTAIVVDDASDFQVGGRLRFVDMSAANTWEDCTITAVNVGTNTVTVGTAPTRNYTAGEDKVVMRKKFINDDTFLLFNTKSADGMPISEFLAAPYGMDRRWGMDVDIKDEWDPDGIWVRVQDKGLPVLYHPDTSYRITVR